MAKAGPRPGARRRQQSADVRAALVSAAIDALRETGYGGASAREIASRAGCSQALVFYHFGSVNDLLLAALDEVSSRRLAVYRSLLTEATSATALAVAARRIFTADLDAGYVRVLVEMITAAHAVPGLGDQVAERLQPWRELTEQAVQSALGRSAAARLLPPADAARALVAGFLGLEVLASLDNDRAAALALLDRAGSLARLLDVLAGLRLQARGDDTPRRPARLRDGKDKQ
jgi:AcrR family transcriptional regulator